MSTNQSNLHLRKIIILFLLFSNVITFSSCQNSVDDDTDNKVDTIVVTPKTPGELKQELLFSERENPILYLKQEGTWRKNFIDQIVLEGSISNTATLANFKDIILKVTWLTKTETELGTNKYVIYEYVKSGKSIQYKLKTDDAPNATGNVKIEIESATSSN